MSNESVLVIPSKKAFGLGVTRGFTADTNLATLLIGATDSMEFRPRFEVETDESWLQLIPYCVLVNNAGYVFSYQRGKSGGEDRLHAKMSVGIGGHINPSDAGENKYYAGLFRELNEEVDVEPGSMSVGHPVALVYDPSDEVGRVHLGVVHIADIGDSTVNPLEDGIAVPMMLDVESLKQLRDRMEGWSQMCIDYLENRE